MRHFYLAVLRGAWTQLHQTWRGHRAIMGQARILFRSSDILLYFRTRAAHIWVIRERCWKWRQILHVLILVKSRTAVGEISTPIVEALPATEPPEYIFITIYLFICSSICKYKLGTCTVHQTVSWNSKAGQPALTTVHTYTDTQTEAHKVKQHKTTWPWPRLIDGHPLHGCWARCIAKKEKKES